jgi:hypothetical protein
VETVPYASRRTNRARKPLGLKLVEQIQGDLGAIRRALRAPLESEIARGELTARPMVKLSVRMSSLVIGNLQVVPRCPHQHGTGTMTVKILLQTTIVTSRDDWAIGRFELLV